jgi:pimeloyl-ACP methyl ester carboxylesterase
MNRRALQLLACCWLAVPLFLAAQPRTVTLSHGLNSSPETWSITGPALAALRPDLVFQSPGTEPTDSYSQQAAAYRNETASLWTSPLTSPRPVMAVGHSNGGVLLREAIRQGLIRPTALMTVGSPNTGAALITQWPALIQQAFTVGDRVWDPLWYYWVGGEHCPLWCYSIANAAMWMLSVEDGIRTQVTSLFLASPGLQSDMTPGSSFHQTLASGTSFEASQVPLRFAVISSPDVFEHPLAQAVNTGQPASFSPLLEDLEALYIMAYDYYANYTSPSNDPNDWNRVLNLRSNARRWLDGAIAADGWATQACNSVGGAPYRIGSLTGCSSDGVVPVSRQILGGNAQNITLSNGPGHIKQTSSQMVRAQILGALNGSVFP